MSGFSVCLYVYRVLPIILCIQGKQVLTLLAQFPTDDDYYFRQGKSINERKPF